MRRGRAAGPGPSETRALQAALAAEQSAIYGYGVVGSHLGGATRALATSYWTAHQVAADQLTVLLQARGASPAPAAAAYQLRREVSTAAQAISLAVILEDQVTSAYLALVAVTDTSLRMLGAGGVRTAALRAAAWRGSTEAFPGLPARALAGRPSAGQRENGGSYSR